MKSMYKLLLAISSCCIATTASTQNIPILDSSFSNDGWDRQYIHHNGTTLHNFLLDADNKPLMVMQGNFASEAHQAMVVRYHTNGTLDETYNDSGIIKTAENFSDPIYSRATGSCRTSDGGMYIAADYWYVGERVIKLKANGSLDSTFGGTGYVDFNPGTYGFFYDIDVIPDGTIIVLGKNYFNGSSMDQFYVLALTPNGGIKSSFGNNGVAAFNLPSGFTSSDVSIWGMEVMEDNTIMLHVNLHNHVFNFKINNNGHLVTTYNGDGIAMNIVPGDLYSSFAMNHFKRDNNNNFWRVYRGYDSTTQSNLDRVMKINADGSLDPISFNNGFSLNSELQLQYFLHWSNNKIYITGFYHTDPTKQYIFRFNQDGTLDNTFNVTGKWAFPDGVSHLQDAQMLTDTSGSLYIAGIDNSIGDSVHYVIIKLKDAEISSTTSINTSHANSLQISISPNPVKDVLNIHMNKEATVALYNIAGQLINKTTAPKKESIAMNHLPAGLYIIVAGGKSYKVVKVD